MAGKHTQSNLYLWACIPAGLVIAVGLIALGIMLDRMFLRPTPETPAADLVATSPAAPPTHRNKQSNAPAASPRLVRPTLPAVFEATVIKPIDGDTLMVLRPGQVATDLIQLAGIKAPAKANRETIGQEPWGTRAQQFLTLQVTRKPVRVEVDTTRATLGGATYAYLWLGDTLVNEMMLREGHAQVDPSFSSSQYAGQFQSAQAQAKAEALNIWDPQNPLGKAYELEQIAKRPESGPPLTLAEQLSIPAFVEGCVIGNTDSKKFHVPGGQYYEQAKTSIYAIFFPNAEAALQAGYEQSTR